MTRQMLFREILFANRHAGGWYMELRMLPTRDLTNAGCWRANFLSLKRRFREPVSVKRVPDWGNTSSRQKRLDSWPTSVLQKRSSLAVWDFFTDTDIVNKYYGPEVLR